MSTLHKWLREHQGFRRRPEHWNTVEVGRGARMESVTGSGDTRKGSENLPILGAPV